jgi:hypothetical protein
VKDEVLFTPQEAGRSSGLLDAGFCKMEVTVAWSLVTYDEYNSMTSDLLYMEILPLMGGTEARSYGHLEVLAE